MKRLLATTLLSLVFTLACEKPAQAEPPRAPSAAPLPKKPAAPPPAATAAPDPNVMSTSTGSAMIGISRPVSGSRTCFPIAQFHLGSSGCTATAVSPSMVSGRVVENVIDSSVPFTG